MTNRRNIQDQDVEPRTPALCRFGGRAEHEDTVEELRQIAKEQRTILDTVTAGICLLRAEKIQWVNPAFEVIFGYSADECRDQNTRRFYVSAEDYDRVYREGYQELAPGSVYSAELLLKRKDGDEFWCQINGRAVDPQRMIESSIWVLQDVDKQKRAEADLLASEARLDAAQQQTHIGSWELDLDLSRGFWSKEMFRLFGMEPGQRPPLFADFVGLIDPEDRARLLEVHQRVEDTGVPCRVEFRSNPSLGRARFFSSNIQACRDPSGTLIGMAGTLQDVTEQRDSERERWRLQEQLQQAMKMEAIGRLAGGVAHDFNNLLTVIRGNVELARTDLSPADPLMEYLDEVSTAAANATDLTGQLLAFSRRQILEPRTLSLNALIGSLRNMLSRLIGEDIALETVLAPDLAAVKVDEGQFKQVILNLSVNARDAMPDGGILHLETANADLDAGFCLSHPQLKPGECVVLTVGDTGQGMSKDVRAHVFEPFFTTKPAGRGTGLGLAMAFGAVTQAGGTIDVRSEQGHGTTFKIYLPRAKPAAEETTPTDGTTALPQGNELILIVEDEASVRNVSTTFLRRQGYQVVDVPSGEEGLAFAERCTSPIQLLFTDIVLPGMNGRELAEKLRSLHPEMTVLLTSGYTEDTILRKGVMADLFNFISKPYALQALARKVRELLDGKP